MPLELGICKLFCDSKRQAGTRRLAARRALPPPSSTSVPAVPNSGRRSPAAHSARSSRPGPPCRPRARLGVKQGPLTAGLAGSRPVASSRSRDPSLAADPARGERALRQRSVPRRRAAQPPGPITVAARRRTGRGLMEPEQLSRISIGQVNAARPGKLTSEAWAGPCLEGRARSGRRGRGRSLKPAWDPCGEDTLTRD